MTSSEALGTAAMASIIGTVVCMIVAAVRRRIGTTELMRRYQCRAHRSAVLSDLNPSPWADRPYGIFRPEDV